MIDFYAQNNITLKQHGLDGNKYPFKELEIKDVALILKDILNKENHPILIHCNKGKHRTGSVIGCLRKMRGWALTSIMNEYYLFALPKARLEDQIFIQSFDPNILTSEEFIRESAIQDKNKKIKPKVDDDDDD